MSSMAISPQALQDLYDVVVMPLTLAFVILTRESSTVDFEQDPSYNMFLPLDAQCSALTVIVGVGVACDG